MEKPVKIRIDKLTLDGELGIPKQMKGVVLFAHGCVSYRLSPRNTHVARVLQKEGIGTLLFGLLTNEEDQSHNQRYDIELMSRRLVAATHWLSARPEMKGMTVGYFGVGTGAAAALQGASLLGSAIKAVVSRAGRPDLAMTYLEKVVAPTLLIVGERDKKVLQLNRLALVQLVVEKELAVVSGASHLFEEPGTLDQAANLATSWFIRHFG
jgi:putative phosphoribosyl transferase